ncbi:MAG: hypothetical protein JNL52_07015 [Flavobacteriales bacterium]|nr:hypothetical protein [Flavobacteriales bacterium]
MLPKDGPKVVYLLGAGASANALPIVSLMPDALRAQVPRLRLYFSDRPEVSNALSKYEMELNNLARLSIDYGTLDTYARSLFLLGSKSAELASLKLHLSMFFLLEPFLAGVPGPKSGTQKGYMCTYSIDPRYMGWLAVLLSDGLELNRRVRVLSWNYDFQVEFALARYCEAGSTDQMHERYNIHPSAADKVINEHDFFLTHLNGIAGQERRDNGIHPWYRMHVGVAPGAAAGLFKLYGAGDVKGLNLRSGFQERMTFAWENNQVAQRAIVQAEHALREADVLVVIGYSFPAFNRFVDKRLMAAFQQGTTRKRLVIQNPNASKEDLLNLFEVDQDIVEISLDTNRDQFHLPNELFVG